MLGVFGFVELDFEVGVVGVVDDFFVLVVDLYVVDSQWVFVDDVGVWFDHVADDGFVLAEDGFDDELVGVVGGWVGGEDDVGLFGWDYDLHNHCDGWFFGEL